MNLPLSVTLFGFTVSTYTFIIAGSLLMTTGLALWTLRKTVPPRRTVDACLCGLAGGYALARLEHIALHADYFAAAGLPPAEWLFPVREGGFGWHGAVIGAALGLWIGGRALRVPFAALVSALAPAVPLIAFAGWLGCAAVGCAYGREVDTLARFSPLMVTESRDLFGIVAPRLFTHGFGMAAAVGIGGLLVLRRPLHSRDVVFSLALLSAAMFAIGFWRADAVPVWWGWRADQALDALVGTGSLALWARTAPRNRSSDYEAKSGA
ncbi:MAG: prolipoprotein diacylglyceryl transferase [bacterium]|nr:prolipoprotein diacylglyceryl transferase [bacterium]